MFLPVLMALHLAHAENKPQSLTYNLNVKETIVQTGEFKYRKIEYKNKFYYLKLLQTEQTGGQLQLYCNENPWTENPPNLVQVSTQVTQRSQLFIEGLQQTCEDLGAGKKKVAVNSNILIGFSLGDGKKDVLKHKRIYWAPGAGLGFMADW